MTDNRICAATPRQSLEDQILNENEPKNEREWWACRHIKYLRDEVIAERNVDIEQLRQRVTEKDEVIAEAGEMLAMRDRQLAALKTELREICAAIDDPACDLTLTAVECIKKLKAENESLKRDAERYRWLKSQEPSKHDGYAIGYFDACGVDAWRMTTKDLDQATDAAMAQGEK